MSGETPVPVDLVRQVDQYVSSELADADKYQNRSPLDESGVWSLHRLVAEAYARGFADGAAVEGERGRAQATRERARLRAKIAPPAPREDT